MNENLQKKCLGLGWDETFTLKTFKSALNKAIKLHFREIHFVTKYQIYNYI